MEDNNFALEVLKHAKEQYSAIIKRLITALIIIILLFLATNVYWIYKCYSPTDTETYDISSQDNGNAVYNNDGKVNINGKSKSN